jgi:hypothetical protein
MLTAEQLAAIRQRKNRYMGQWTGTAGSLAADCHHLLEDREAMESTIADLKEKRCAGERCQTDTVDIPADWILQGEQELRQRGDSVMRAAPDHELPPAEKLLLDTLEVIRDRRPKYGGPRDHFRRTVGMINAAFSQVLKRPLTEADWAIIMTLDKVARYMGPTKTSDGPVDLAGYAACLAEVEQP